MKSASLVLVLKNLAFVLVVPGGGCVLLPWLLAGRPALPVPASWSAAQWIALLPLSVAVVAYAWCMVNFAVVGRGTPAPIDPPKVLVVRGPYRFVRNPMYVIALTVLFGWSLFYRSAVVLGYAAAVGVGLHLFVVFFEEPILRRKFGEDYARYCRHVRRWVPGRGWGG